MGLDSVEIVLGWEEAFGVTISDGEAATLSTPRMAADLFSGKLGATEGSPNACLTLRAFHKVRHGFVDVGFARRQITPKARLRALLPRLDRKSRWSKIQGSIGLPALPNFGLMSGPATVADLIQWVISHSPQALKVPNEPWTRSEVRVVVRSVITEVCGATDFADDHDFIHDIGID